ncbi:50S ribosomal protein L31e [Candidatus Bathyarchaeota archaeon]|nr:50S ribosomal protein L31e [Candidatus Bathyarchaeota archaeon]
MVKVDKQELAKTEEDTPNLKEDENATEEPTEEASKEETSVEEQPAEEKAKPKKKKKEEEEIVEERFYTIPLSRALVRPPKKRAPRAIQLIKAFITKHMKLAVKVSEDEEEEELPQLIISTEVNEKVWDRGIEKPPRKIRVRAAKDKDGNVTVYLAEAE